MDLKRFEAVSFDCYGTLIDWQRGILRAIRPALERAGLTISADDLVRDFAARERQAERLPYRSYKHVLEEVAAGLLARSGGDPTVLWKSLADPGASGWPEFADTADSLRRLQHHARIAIVSNVDDDLFAATRPRLGIEPDVVVTAQQVQSYKPGRAHFDELIRRLRLPADRVLHAAESRFHDIQPALALGFDTVWVNRTGAGPTASGEGTAQPTFTVSSLAELADLFETAHRRTP